MQIRKIMVLMIIGFFIGASNITGIANQNYKSIENVSFDSNLTEYWAILVGPPDIDIGDPNNPIRYRFASEMLFLKNKLIENGWNEDHIKLLYMEEATYDNLLDAYQWMDDNDKPCDIDFLAFSSHGGINGQVNLWGGGYFYSDMNEDIAILDSDSIVISIDACFSGTAIPELKGEGRLVMTDCNAIDFADAMLSWHMLNCFGKLGDKLNDNNGVVSVEEAFNYMDAHSDKPQIDDQIPGNLHFSFLDFQTGVIDQHCLLPIIDKTSGYGIDNDDYLAQSFIPQYSDLIKVKINVHPSINANSLNVSIRESLDGPDLTSVSIPNSELYHSNGYQEADFPDITVTPGETYYIVCTGTEAGGWAWNCHIDMDTDYDIYENGEAYFYSHSIGEWLPYNGMVKDYYFCTFTNAIGNYPPIVPRRPGGPILGNTDIEHEFFFSTTDGEGDQIKYQIDWGDGDKTWTGFYSSGSTTSLSHAWSLDGMYYVKVRAQDDQGESSDWSSYLKVEIISNDPPQAFIDVIDPNPAEEGTSVYFSGHGTDTDGSIIEYQWRSDIDGVLTTESSFSISTLSVGEHNIFFKVKDDFGSWSSEDSESLIITEVSGNAPNAFIDYISPNPAGYGKEVSFVGHGVDPDGFISSYEWSSDIDGILNLEESFTTSDLSIGEHVIKFRVRDNGGHWSEYTTDTLLIDYSPENPSINGPTSGKIDELQTYHISSSDPYDDRVRYIIDWGDEDTENTDLYDSGEIITRSHKWNRRGNFLIKVKAIDEKGIESEWKTLTVSMSKIKIYNNPFFIRFFERFPLLEKLINNLVR